jgi:hypothetical protein
MRKKMGSTLLVVSMSLFVILSTINARAALKVGDPAPRFMLASTQDKPVDYTNDYYGKFHLVLEFFPNAFGGG